MGWAVGLWSGPDADSRLSDVEYFSGTATYRHNFHWEPAAVSKVVLDLGDVHDLAEARLDGHRAGVPGHGHSGWMLRTPSGPVATPWKWQ